MMKKAMSSRRVRCPDLPPVEEEQTQSKKHFKDRRIWWKKTVSDRQAKKGKEASSSDNGKKIEGLRIAWAILYHFGTYSNRLGFLFTTPSLTSPLPPYCNSCFATVNSR